MSDDPNFEFSFKFFLEHFGKKYFIEGIRMLPYMGAATLGGAAHLILKVLKGEKVSKIYMLMSLFISYNAAYLVYNFVLANMEEMNRHYLEVIIWCSAFCGSAIINRIPGTITHFIDKVGKKIEKHDI